MNVEHLSIFMAVYRAGGFAPVAMELGIAPSSVSRVVAKLETDLAVRLFQRTTRHLSPTKAGDIFFARIAPLVEEFHAVREELLDQTQKPHGILRITASVSYGQAMIAPRLKTFTDMYPEIKLELLLSDSHIDIISERIDLAVRHGKLADSSLVARKLTHVSYRIVASPEYLKNAQRLVVPEDIACHPTIAFLYDEFRSSWMVRKGAIEKEIMINPVVAVSNAQTIHRCVCDGAGIALLPDWLIERDLNEGRLINVLPDWEGAGRTFDSAIWLVFASRAYVPEKVRVFAEFLSGLSDRQ
ncbi:MAG: LysR family transcriptional regulator [Arenicella sp.]